jgi:transposase
MTVRERIASMLRGGAMEIDELARRVGGKKDTVERTVRRYKEQFIVLDDGKVALRQRTS